MDNLGSAVCGGSGGMACSQGPAFTQAYLQRLGGHIDEAQRAVAQIEAGTLMPWLTDTDRARAASEFSARVQELEAAYQAIASAHPVMQPVMMLRYAETDIAARTMEFFTPALPLDLASLVYTAAGVILALVVYELVKSPAFLFRKKERRLA